MEVLSASFSSLARRDLPGVLVDLQALALLLGQRLVVRHLGHEGGDLGPEALLEILVGGVGVLERVVQQAAHQQHDVLAAGRLGEQGGHLGQVVDVGLGPLALAPLRDVLAGGVVGGARQLDQIGAHQLLLCDQPSGLSSRAGRPMFRPCHAP